MAVVAAPLVAATPLPGADADLDMYCAFGVGLDSQDYTTAANDATPLDVPLGDDGLPGLAPGPEVAFGDNVMLIGSKHPFTAIAFDIGRAGVDRPSAPAGLVAWRYSTASGPFRPLQVVDGTGAFHLDGLRQVTFTPPEDWAPRTTGACAIDSLFLVEFTTQGPYLLRPLANQVSIDLVSQEGPP
jgi:hypothetical protein